MTEGLANPWGELTLYYRYAELLKRGAEAYVDFHPEYPPLALVLFRIADVFGKQWFTLMWYGMVSLAVLAIVWLVKRLKGNPYVFLASVLPLGGLFWDRFDVFPALLTLLAVYLAVKNYILFAFIILAYGVLMKLYPILLLPVLIGIAIKRKRYERLVFGLIFFLALLVRDEMKAVIKLHRERGFQIESIRAMPKLLNKDSIVEFKHNTFEIR